MTQLVIDLDDKLASDLSEISQEERVPKDRLVADVMQRWLTARFLRKSQEQLGPLARASGYETEDDLLRDLS